MDGRQIVIIIDEEPLDLNRVGVCPGQVVEGHLNLVGHRRLTEHAHIGLILVRGSGGRR